MYVKLTPPLRVLLVVIVLFVVMIVMMEYHSVYVKIYLHFIVDQIVHYSSGGDGGCC